jgi:hypothetical protein
MSTGTVAGCVRATSDSAVLTAQEVKVSLRCGLSTVYELFNRGDLRGFRIGKGNGGVRFLAKDVEAFVDARLSEPRREAAPEPVRSEPVRAKRRRASPGISGLYLRLPEAS